LIMPSSLRSAHAPVCGGAEYESTAVKRHKPRKTGGAVVRDLSAPRTRCSLAKRDLVTGGEGAEKTEEKGEKKAG
jgi:hypothetical protein